MPFYYNELGERKNKMVSQVIAYTADGFLLPCCWCDNESMRADMEKLGLYNENLKLSNNTTVDNILFSAEWTNFTKVITQDFDRAPRCCREKCGVINE